MKILLIFVLYLISGPADGSNVTGYSGGSVIICSDQKWDSRNSKYICKIGQPGCTDVIRSHPKSYSVQSGRFMLYNRIGGFVGVFVKRLKPQDAGTYRIGIENQNSYDTVNLKVINDFCCGRTNIMNAHLGESITLTYKYPEKYKAYYKYITKFNDDANIQAVINTTTISKNGRFSISDNKSAKVISVKISNVIDDDEGYYLCGVWKKGGSVGYYTYFTEIQLKITEHTATFSTGFQPTTAYMTTSAAPRATWSDHACYTTTSLVIIIVSVVVALLLIGGFVMIYKLRCTKIQGSPMMNYHKNAGYEDSDRAHLYEKLRMNYDC